MPALPGSTSFERPNRFKPRDEVAIRWIDLLERFRIVQERAKASPGEECEAQDVLQLMPSEEVKGTTPSNINISAPSTGSVLSSNAIRVSYIAQGSLKPKSTLSTFGRFTSGVGGRRQRK